MMSRVLVPRKAVFMGCMFWFLTFNLFSAESRVLDASLSPKELDNFYEARVRLWIPPGIEKLNGVLVLLGGTDSDARSSIDNLEWKEFAKIENLALLGCYFRGEGEPYEDAKGGSGDALLEMTRLLAVKSGRTDIRDAPLLLVGHSAGAMFSFNFACWKPEKVLSFVLIKSGPIPASSNAATANVPGLFIVGESDLPCRVQSASTAFLNGLTQFEARWALAVEPNGGHGSSTAVMALARTYLRDAIECRKNGSHVSSEITQPGKYVCLSKPLDASFSKIPDKTDSAWLPGATSAMVWSRFVKPISLSETATSGGKEERRPIAVNPAVLDLGQIDIRRNSGEAQKSFSVNIPSLGDAKCRFVTDDKRLAVTFEKQNETLFSLTVRIAAQDLKPGYFHSRVQVVTDKMGLFVLPVTGQVVTDYRARPASLYVGVLPRGSISEMNVALNSDSGERVKVTGIKSSNPSFAQARFEAPGNVVCHFDGKHSLGNQSGYFDLAISGPGKRELRIPFIAWVSKRSTND